MYVHNIHGYSFYVVFKRKRKLSKISMCRNSKKQKKNTFLHNFSCVSSLRQELEHVFGTGSLIRRKMIDSAVLQKPRKKLSTCPTFVALGPRFLMQKLELKTSGLKPTNMGQVDSFCLGSRDGHLSR